MTFRNLFRGIMVLAALVLLTAPGAAAPGVWDDRAVPVATADGVHCSLDATTVKRFTGLSGATFVDVWVKYRFAAGAGHALGTTGEIRAAGLTADEVREVRVRYLFWLADGRSDQGPLEVALEKQYLDAAGGVLYRQEFSAPGYLTKWSRVDALEEKVLLRLVTQPAFHANYALDPALARSAPITEADEGFLGFPWGTRPGAFADAVHVTDVGEELAVYHAAADVWPLLGGTRAYAGVWLIFSRRDGLVMARVDVDDSRAGAVEKHLFLAAGQPLIVEKRGGSGAPGELQLHWLWHTGRTTAVALLDGLRGTTVVVSRRDFSLPETGTAFEARLAAALAHKAETHRKGGEPLAASAYHQLLLNTSRGYNGFITESQRQLAALSGRDECRALLGRAPGLAVWGLHNVLPVSGGQRWIRVDFDQAFREELAARRPADSGYAVPAAALCRVRTVPVAAGSAIVEQIYLDAAGGIIGGRPAGAPQGTGWPAEPIKEKGETFLNEYIAAGLAAAWAPAAADGFAGIPWGAAPGMVDEAVTVGGANLGLATVLFTDALGRGWGENVELTGPGLMVFDRRRGFVGVSYRFEGAYYRQIYDALQAKLGSPYTDKAATVTWRVGANTVYVLDFTEGGKTGVVTVADRDFWYSRSILFEYL